MGSSYDTFYRPNYGNLGYVVPVEVKQLVLEKVSEDGKF